MKPGEINRNCSNKPELYVKVQTGLPNGTFYQSNPYFFNRV
jgi:hypothetical protein